MNALARRLLILLAAVAPFLACWIFIDAYALPTRLEPQVLNLAGSWKLQEGDDAHGADPALDDSLWKEIRSRIFLGAHESLMPYFLRAPEPAARRAARPSSSRPERPWSRTPPVEVESAVGHGSLFRIVLPPYSRDLTTGRVK